MRDKFLGFFIGSEQASMNGITTKPFVGSAWLDRLGWIGLVGSAWLDRQSKSVENAWRKRR
jgi:hypothetical protein